MFLNWLAFLIREVYAKYDSPVFSFLISSINQSWFLQSGCGVCVCVCDFTLGVDVKNLQVYNIEAPLFS